LALYLIDNAAVTVSTVIIKFGRTIKISSLVNANFIVQTNEATPTVVSSPFKTIDSLTDYNQINRTLTLYWNVILDSNTEYIVRAVGLIDSSGYEVPEEYVTFTTEIESATPALLDTVTGTIINEVLIEDKSVRADIETGYQIIAKNPDFYISSVNPNNGEYFVDNADVNGRVAITFNARPASNFITSKFFKAQRKKIQRTPTRWESVSTVISMHSWKPEVYVDFPSNDATPVYYTEDKTYFESGYKYRVIISSEVGI
jgi:hypothetical protein